MSLQSQVSFVWEGVDHGEDDGDVDQGEGGVVGEDDLHLREGRQW